MDTPAANSVAYRLEPQEGWLLQGFSYFTKQNAEDAWSTSPAVVFLAEDGAGTKQGVQWFNWGNPTQFHGDWEEGDSTLSLRFNCRGPRHEDGTPRFLKVTYVQLRPRSSEHPLVNVYEGFDQGGRHVKMVPNGAWILTREQGALVWKEAPLKVA